MVWIRGLLICTILVLSVVSERHSVHELMYTDLDSSAACFRRLNGTHQFGCSSDGGGNVGVIQLISNQTDLDNFLKYSSDNDYMIVLPMVMFTESVMNNLTKRSNIVGVVIIVEEANIPEHYSPDDVCPNPLFSSCRDEQINPYGNKFLFTDWPFPMFLVDNPKTISKIKECYKRFNEPFEEYQSSRPLCSIHMKSHMSAAVDSPTCIRRETEAGARVLKYCDPLGDQNIILPMGEFNSPKSARNIIIIAARLDAASLFDGLSPGVISSGTAIVSLLTTANILNNLLENHRDKQVLFMLFNGEAHDYIGSSRVVYDLKNGEFSSTTSLNISLESIMYFIELSQIDSSRVVYLHTTNDYKIKDFSQELMYSGSQYSLKIKLSNFDGIPPSSLQTFIREDSSIPGIVISNYDVHYSNKYFNSFLDNSISIHYANDTTRLSLQKNIAYLSSAIAKTVFKTLTGDTKEVDEKSALDLVSDLLECYVKSRACKMMKMVNSGDDSILNSGNGPWPLYVSVRPSPNPITMFTGLLLAYVASPRIYATKDNCTLDSPQNTFNYIFVKGPNNTGVCLNTTLKFTPAVSPAFIIPGYDWSSGNYSTWTESIWTELSLGMFLKPSRKQEIITFCVGLAVSFLSFLSLFWLNKNSSKLFSSTHPCSLLTTNC